MPLLILIMLALAAAGVRPLGVAMERFAYRPFATRHGSRR